MGKRGPEPKGEYANKSSVFSTRIRPDLRDALEAAAKASGRSLSQEVEHRLRRTFIEDTRIEDAFGSRRNYRLMQMAALAANTAERLTMEKPGSSWLDDPVAFDSALRFITGVLEAIRPPAKAEPDDEYTWTEDDRRRAAEANADFTWEDVREADPSLPLNAPGEDARERLFHGLLKSELGPLSGRTGKKDDGNAR